jgi:O-antigen/teichoic acid export membrane protein
MLWCLSPIRPKPGFDRSVAGELLGYGKHVSVNAIVGFAANNVDYLLVGYFLGARALGIYTMAFIIASLPSTAISQISARVMFPALTKIRDDHVRFTKLFNRTLTLVWSASILSGIVILVASPLYAVRLMGDEWDGIERPLQILAIYGILRSLVWVFSPAYKALGHPQVDWHLNLLRLVVATPLLALGARWDIEGIAAMQVAVAAVFLPVSMVGYVRVSRIPLRRFARTLVPQAVAITGSAAVLTIVAVMSDTVADATEQVPVLLTCAAATAVYAALLYASDGELRSYSRHLLGVGRHRHAPSDNSRA